jgi:hypothetical protein
VVCTTLAHKRKESKALASCIKHTSFEMFLCSRCKKRNFKYIVSNKENSGCCSEYVLCKVSCNVKGIPVGEWRTLKVKTDCLKHKKEVAFA